MSKRGKLPSMEELVRMGKKELQKVARTIQRRVGSRLKKLEQAKGLEKSPAKAQLERSGGGIKYGGLDRNELLHEIKRGKDFLEDKTGTVTGAREFYKDVKTGLEGAGVNLKDRSNEEVDKMFEAYKKAQDELPAIANINFKYMAMENINKLIAENDELTPDELSRIVIDELDKKYQLSQESDLGDFVTLEEDDDGDDFVYVSEEDEEKWL